MGNCTVTLKGRPHFDSAAKRVTADVALSTSYATGGDTVPINLFELGTLRTLVVSGGATTPAGHAVEVIHGADEKTAPKLRIRDVATGVEITNATNLSAQSVRVEAIGDSPV